MVTINIDQVRKVTRNSIMTLTTLAKPLYKRRSSSERLSKDKYTITEVTRDKMKMKC